MSRTISTISLRARAIVIGLAAFALVAGGLGADRATAMTPAQTTESGVVNLLGGWVPGYVNGTIDDFWRRTMTDWGYGNRYAKPGIQYYGAGTGGYYDVAGCTSSAQWAGENGFYCSNTKTIYLDYFGQQAMLNRLGDHAAGGLLAHEWAHRAQDAMNTLVNDFRREYNADCMAGLYTRFGYNSGRLSGNDFGEFYTWLYNQPSSGSHGTGANRAAWFHYGYMQYTKAACDLVLQTPVNIIVTASGASARARTSIRKARLAAARRLHPPVRLVLDTTPRRSTGLPPGGGRIRFPKSQQLDPNTPVG
jgi:predicted metalloprotease